MSTQSMADQIKRLLEELHVTPEQRKTNRAAYKLLQRFEDASWHGPAWHEALDDVDGVRLTDDGKLEVERTSDATNRLVHLMGRFLMLSGQQELPDMYNVEEAAAFLGTTPRTILHHHHNSGKLKGKVVRGIYFTREQLEDFKDNWPQPGRPRRLDQSQTDSTAEGEPVED